MHRTDDEDDGTDPNCLILDEIRPLDGGRLNPDAGSPRVKRKYLPRRLRLSPAAKAKELARIVEREKNREDVL
jgi:hypothetical protein